MTYVPILKGKLGEFTALGHMASDVQAGVRPVLEVVPDGQVHDVLATFFKHACERLPEGLDLAVDCGELWRHGPVGGVWHGPPLSWLSEAFDQWMLALIPVFRPCDPDDALAEVRKVQRVHGCGAVMRVELASFPSDHSQASRTTARTLRRIALEPAEIDLLLDARQVEGRDRAIRCVPDVLTALRWARSASWRSVTVAAGAFPRSLRSLPRERLIRLPRWDIALWRKLASDCDGPTPDFGDYGITHPVMSVAPGRRAAPNLRYTLENSWIVSVASARHQGNDGFFVLCEQLEGAGLGPARVSSSSWGDSQLAVCARRQRPKAGRPADWRAWATSRHLAVTTAALEGRQGP